MAKFSLFAGNTLLFIVPKIGEWLTPPLRPLLYDVMLLKGRLLKKMGSLLSKNSPYFICCGEKKVLTIF